MTLKYFKSLDGLRAIAALAVIVAHFFVGNRVSGLPQIIPAVASLGNSGVSLFFVLSGFVITRILINSRENRNYFKAFYARRTLRIFPLYYFALICYYTIPYLLNLEPEPLLLTDTIFHFTYTQNIAQTFGWGGSGPAHFWSLAIEEHFYLVWPALIFFFYKTGENKMWYLIGCIMIISFVLKFVMLSKGYPINYFTLTRLNQLAMGAGLAFLETRGKLSSNYTKVYLIVASIGLIAFGVCSSLSFFYRELLKHESLGLLFFGLIALCTVHNDKGRIANFLRSDSMQFLGKISYGIYVWHVLCILLVRRLFSTGNLLLDFLLVLFFTIFLSAGSFLLIEKLFLNLKHHFPNGRHRGLQLGPLSKNN